MYIVFIMMRVFARTREREKGWRLGTYSLLGSAIGAPFVYLIFRKYISGPVLLKVSLLACLSKCGLSDDTDTLDIL